MSRIIVQMGGGLIRGVFKTGKGEPKEVVVVDLEVEQEELDADPDRVTNYIGADKKPSQCIIQDFGFDKLPKKCDVVRSIKAWETNWKTNKKN